MQVISSFFCCSEKRREKSERMIVKQNVDFYKKTDRYSFRHNDKLTLRKKYARTNLFKYSYFHRLLEHGTPYLNIFVGQQV